MSETQQGADFAALSGAGPSHAGGHKSLPQMFFAQAERYATLPRYRYDQLMRLGWKVFLPLSLIMVAAVAGVLHFFDLAP